MYNKIGKIISVHKTNLGANNRLFTTVAFSCRKFNISCMLRYVFRNKTFRPNPFFKSIGANFKIYGNRTKWWYLQWLTQNYRSLVCIEQGLYQWSNGFVHLKWGLCSRWKRLLDFPSSLCALPYGCLFETKYSGRISCQKIWRKCYLMNILLYSKADTVHTFTVCVIDTIAFMCSYYVSTTCQWFMTFILQRSIPLKLSVQALYCSLMRLPFLQSFNTSYVIYWMFPSYKFSKKG